MEDFSEAHQYTFQALGAIGTLLACIISLVFGLSSNKPKLKASILLRSIANHPQEEYVAVQVQNIGSIPISIPLRFLRFKILFRKSDFIGSSLLSMILLNTRLKEDSIPTKTHPYKIEAKNGENEVFFLNLKEEFFAEKKSNFPKGKINCWLLNLIKAEILISDGTTFNVKVPKEIKKLIKQNLKN